MSEIILPAGKEEKKPEDLIIPVVTEPTFVYKKDTKMFCVIIPADKVDAFTASCILDSMKMTYMRVVQSLMAEAQEKNSKIYKPGMMAEMKNFLKKK